MSNDFDLGEPVAATFNPFQSPATSGGGHYVTRLPVYCTVVFIIDLVFSVIRLFLVPLSILGGFRIYEAAPDNPLLPTIPFEIIAGAGMALFGILGGAMLLAKNRVGILLGWTKVGFALLGILVGVWQFTVSIGSIGRNQGAVMAGTFIALAFRLGLTVLFASGVWTAQKVFAQADALE